MQVVHRHAHAVEEELAGVLRLQAHLVEPAPAPKARRGVALAQGVGLHHDQRRALGAERLVGLAHHDDDVGVLAVGDEGLGPVDHVVVAVAHGARAHGLQVAARAGLGHRDGADELAGDHLGQPAALLLVGAAFVEVRRDDRRMQTAAEAAEHGARRFHEDHRVVAEVAAAAAVFLRRGCTQQAVGAGFAPGLERHLAFFAPLGRLRHPAFAEEARGAVLQHAVLVGHPDRREVLDAHDFAVRHRAATRVVDHAQLGQRGVDVRALGFELRDRLVGARQHPARLLLAALAVRAVELEKGLDLRQRRADRLAAQDQRQPRAVAPRVDARVLHAARREQALVFVEAHGARRDAELGAQVADAIEVVGARLVVARHRGMGIVRRLFGRGAFANQGLGQSGS